MSANICSLIPLYIVNHQEFVKKNNNDSNFLQKSRAEKNNIAPSFMLMWHGFVRRNFIGHNGWSESTNQLRQHISHKKPCMFRFIVWGRPALYWYKDNPGFLPIFFSFYHYSCLSPNQNGIFMFLPSHIKRDRNILRIIIKITPSESWRNYDHLIYISVLYYFKGKYHLWISMYIKSVVWSLGLL